MKKFGKKFCTFTLEDCGQDFLEIDLYENGVILGNSIMFSDGKISCFLVATKDGKEFYGIEDLIHFAEGEAQFESDEMYLYIKNTGDEDPLPWEAKKLKYKIESISK